MDVEPLFVSMALYDSRERKKVLAWDGILLRVRIWGIQNFLRDMVLYLHSCKRKIKEWFLGWIDDFMIVFKNQFHTLFFWWITLFFFLFAAFLTPTHPQPTYSLYYYIGVHSNYGIFSVIHMILFSDLRDVPLWSELRADKAYDRWSCDTSWYLHAESCMCILHHLPITWCFFGRQGK